MRRLVRPALVAGLSALLLAGCTTSDTDGGLGADPSNDGPSSQPRTTGSAGSPAPAPTGPDCATVWKAGDVLDRDYALCVQDGAAGVQDVTECQDGPPLIVFDDELFARPGEEIQAPSASPVQDTEEYGDAYRECTGG